MFDFLANSRRDAYPTIRGFVFQAAVTIEQWMELQKDQFIELERGEDVDIIYQSLTTKENDEIRLLEQIKYRESPVNLKKPEAISTLIRCIEHIKRNPSKKLFFRYTTNSTICEEKSISNQEKTKSIIEWEKIRNKELSGFKLGIAVNCIKSILQNVKRPKGISDESFKHFQNFVKESDKKEFIEFIGNFEWKTNIHEINLLKEKFQNRLIEKGLASTDAEAEEKYLRLFYYVFQRLTQPGIKKLNIEEREIQLSLPTLSKGDREKLDQLKNYVLLFETRLSNVEEKVKDHDKEMENFKSIKDNISKKIEEYFNNPKNVIKDIRTKIKANIDYTLTNPSLDIPPLVVKHCKRSETIKKLSKIVEKYTWTTIYGTAGSGKTQLCILYSLKRFNYIAWIGLRGLNINQAFSRFDKCCEIMVETPLKSNRYEWYSELCKKIGRNSLIIFDDFPEISGNNDVSQRLYQFLEACKNHNIKILSTSSNPLPNDFINKIDDNVICNIECFPFTDNEIIALLKVHNAPDSIIESDFVKFINPLAKGHPAIVTAIIKYLMKNNWNYDNKTFEGLFKGEYFKIINDETIQKIIETVEESNSKELLYRLGLIFEKFSYNEVTLLASIYPPISLPLEHLNKLKGLWIQCDVNQKYNVSPLIKNLSRNNLQIVIQKKCFDALAKNILNKGTLDQFDVIGAVTYFISADNYRQASLVFVKALIALSKMEKTVDDSRILLLWSSVSLPTQLDLGMRIYIRAWQFRTFNKININTDYIIKDLESLVSQASENEAIPIIVMSLATIPILANKDPIRANKYLLIGLKCFPYAEFPDEGELKEKNSLNLEDLIWLTVGGISTIGHLHNWIDTIEEFTSEQLKNISKSEFAEVGCMMISEILWLKEINKPKNSQNWDLILDETKYIAEKAKILNLELLWINAIRIQIIILAEHLNDLNTAIKLGEKAISEATNDPRVQFLINGCLANEYFFADNIKEGINYFNKAYALEIKSYTGTRILGLIYASNAIGEKDPKVSIQYAKKAVDIADKSKDIPKTLNIQVLGELTIALWLADDLKSAFPYWHLAAEKLISCKDNSKSWKSILCAFGHANGYLLSAAEKKPPPQKTLNGETYVAPNRGFFINYNIDLWKEYKEISYGVIFVQMIRFAEALNYYDIAKKWVLKGSEKIDQTLHKFAYANLSNYLISYMLLNNEFEKSINIALKATIINVSYSEIRKKNKISINDDFEPLQILGSKPSDLWNKVEYYSAILVMLPIAFRIAEIKINKSNIAKSCSNIIEEKCDKVSETASNPQLWKNIKVLFKKTYSSKISFNELFQLSNTFNTEDDSILMIIGYLGATLKDDINLKNAIKGHLVILPWIFKNLQFELGLIRLLILPFIENYWNDKFSRMRFSFISPQLVEQELNNAKNIPEIERSKYILRTIAFGLNIKLDPNSEKWLQEH